jgi:ribosomal protein S18 acetylase RimI-like enzyme
LARRDRNGSLNDGRIQNPSNPFGIVPLSNFAPRGFGFVHRSIAILDHEVPNPNLTVRNFCIAVGEALAGDTPEGRAYLFNLCVCPRARRRGVGSQLLSRAVARASRLGVRFLYVHVERQNTAARHLYARHGFVQCNALDGKLLLVLKMI